MFNLFRKIAAKQYADVSVIEEIHNEFDTATERLLSEAKNILANADKIKQEKADRLKRLGFGQAKEVAETKAQIEEQRKSEALAKSILYYQTYYPSNKFITEEEVIRICKKYGLVWGDVHYYKGDVPEKNLQEIEQFKLRQEDMQVRTNLDDYYEGQMRNMMRSRMAFPSYSEAPTEIIERYVAPPFKICAPQKDFDTRNMIVSKDLKLMEINDPIVLQPVKDGYLVVSKWGMEASDDNLVNEKMN